MARCKTTPKVEQQPKIEPSPLPERVRKFYDDIRARSGVLNTAQKIENELMEDYISSVTGISAPVTLGNYNRVEGALANLLGWKKWLWQNSQQFTEAGAVRESLRRNANQARELIKYIALERNLPEVKKLYRSLKTNALNLSEEQLQMLLHDQIVIGSYRKLLNVNPNEVLNNYLQTRYYKHQQKLVDAGLSNQAIDDLSSTAERIMNTFDELRYAAGESGMDIDALANGGYFPIAATREFEKVQKRMNEKAFSSAFTSPLEDLQKSRKLGVPFALNEDKMVALLQPLLLKQGALGDESLAALGKAELDKAAQEASVVQFKLELIEQKELAALNERLIKENQLNLKQREKARRTVNKLQGVKEQAAINVEREKLYNAGYKKPEVDAILQNIREDYKLLKEEALAQVDSSFDQKMLRRMQTLQGQTRKLIQEKSESLTTASNKRVQAFLKFEEARYKLRESYFREGAVAKMLSTLKPTTVKRLFETGALTQIPVLSDELLNYFRKLDLGVVGLADAIITDPVQAIKNYAADLSKVAFDSQLLKTTLTSGYEEGWVQTSKINDNYIQLGGSAILRKYFENGALGSEVAEMWIHRTAAEQLNGLFEINTSPTWLSTAASTWQSFTSFFGKSALLATGGLPYLQRVFTQNLPSIYAATGGKGLVGLPTAFVDMSRILNEGTGSLDNSRKVFFNGSMTTKELYAQFRLKAGGSVLSGVQETVDAFANPFEVFDKNAWRRMYQFNDAYFKKFGNPLTGKLQTHAEAIKEFGAKAFAAAYAPLAFGNQFLDTTAKWAVVKELAASGQYKTMDEVLNKMQDYFDLSNDPGKVGNFVSRNAVPFASFALNAPGAALRHALSNPYRAVNVAQLYLQAAGSLDLSESELPPWLRESQQYAMSLGKDDKGNHFAVLPGSTDFYLDSAMWFGSLAKDLAGGNSNVTEMVDNLSDPSARWGKRVQELLSKSYVGQAGVALLGVDPRNMEKISDVDSQDTLIGLPMPKRLSIALRSAFPLLRAIDRNAPGFITGAQAETETTPFGQQQTVPAQPGWAGLLPAPGGGGRTNKSKNAPAEAQAFAALTGISLQEIDPGKNLITTYRDFDSRLKEIRRTRNSTYRRMSSTPLTDQQRQLTEQRLNDLKSLEVILLHNKFQMDALALRKGLPVPSIVEYAQQQLNSTIIEPISQDAERQLLEVYLGN